MPIRGESIRVNPVRKSLFGDNSLDPNWGPDREQIQQVLAGYQQGIYSSDQIEKIISQNPKAELFLRPAIQQIDQNKRILSQNFQQQQGPTRPGEQLKPINNFESAINQYLSIGDKQGAAELIKLKNGFDSGQMPSSSRWKFGNVSTEGTLLALDTNTGEVVEFANPKGLAFDRPTLNLKTVDPEGRETTTTGYRGDILSQGPRTTRTNQGQVEKLAIEQRAARGVLSRARQLTEELWTASDDIKSRYGQAADLYWKEFTQSDPRVAQYDSLRQGFMAPLIRALGEKETLAEGDVGRAKNLWPKFNDSRNVAQGKIDQVEKVLDGVLTGKFNNLDQAISETSKKSQKSSATVVQKWGRDKDGNPVPLGN